MSYVTYHLPIGRFACRNIVGGQETWVSAPAMTCMVVASRAWSQYFPAEPAFLPARFLSQSIPTLALSLVPSYPLEILLNWFWNFTQHPQGEPYVSLNGLVKVGPPVYLMWATSSSMLRINYPRLIRFSYLLEGNTHVVNLTFAGGRTDVPNSLPQVQGTNYAMDLTALSSPPWAPIFSQTERGAFTPAYFRFSVGGVFIPVSRLELSFNLNAVPSYAGGTNPVTAAPMPFSAWKVSEEEPVWYWVGRPQMTLNLVSPDTSGVEQYIVKHHIVPNVQVGIPVNVVGNTVRWLVVTLPYAQVETGYNRYLSRSAMEYVAYMRLVGSPFRLTTVTGNV